MSHLLVIVAALLCSTLGQDSNLPLTSIKLDGEARGIIWNPSTLTRYHYSGMMITADNYMPITYVYDFGEMKRKMIQYITDAETDLKHHLERSTVRRKQMEQQVERMSTKLRESVNTLVKLESFMEGESLSRQKREVTTYNFFAKLTCSGIIGAGLSLIGASSHCPSSSDWGPALSATNAAVANLTNTVEILAGVVDDIKKQADSDRAFFIKTMEEDRNYTMSLISSLASALNNNTIDDEIQSVINEVFTMTSSLVSRYATVQISELSRLRRLSRTKVGEAVSTSDIPQSVIDRAAKTSSSACVADRNKCLLYTTDMKQWATSMIKNVDVWVNYGTDQIIVKFHYPTATLAKFYHVYQPEMVALRYSKFCKRTLPEVLDSVMLLDQNAISGEVTRNMININSFRSCGKSSGSMTVCTSDIWKTRIQQPWVLMTTGEDDSKGLFYETVDSSVCKGSSVVYLGGNKYMTTAVSKVKVLDRISKTVIYEKMVNPANYITVGCNHLIESGESYTFPPPHCDTTASIKVEESGINMEYATGEVKPGEVPGLNVDDVILEWENSVNEVLGDHLNKTSINSDHHDFNMQAVRNGINETRNWIDVSNDLIDRRGPSNQGSGTPHWATWVALGLSCASILGSLLAIQRATCGQINPARMAVDSVKLVDVPSIGCLGWQSITATLLIWSAQEPCSYYVWGSLAAVGVSVLLNVILLIVCCCRVCCARFVITEERTKLEDINQYLIPVNLFLTLVIGLVTVWNLKIIRVISEVNLLRLRSAERFSTMTISLLLIITVAACWTNQFNQELKVSRVETAKCLNRHDEIETEDHRDAILKCLRFQHSAETKNMTTMIPSHSDNSIACDEILLEGDYPICSSVRDGFSYINSAIRTTRSYSSQLHQNLNRVISATNSVFKEVHNQLDAVSLCLSNALLLYLNTFIKDRHSVDRETKCNLTYFEDIITPRYTVETDPVYVCESGLSKDLYDSCRGGVRPIHSRRFSNSYGCVFSAGDNNRMVCTGDEETVFKDRRSSLIVGFQVSRPGVWRVPTSMCAVNTDGDFIGCGNSSVTRPQLETEFPNFSDGSQQASTEITDNNNNTVTINVTKPCYHNSYCCSVRSGYARHLGVIGLIVAATKASGLLDFKFVGNTCDLRSAIEWLTTSNWISLGIIVLLLTFSLGNAQAERKLWKQRQDVEKALQGRSPSAPPYSSEYCANMNISDSDAHKICELLTTNVSLVFGIMILNCVVWLSEAYRFVMSSVRAYKCIKVNHTVSSEGSLLCLTLLICSASFCYAQDKTTEVAVGVSLGLLLLVMLVVVIFVLVYCLPGGTPPPDSYVCPKYSGCLSSLRNWIWSHGRMVNSYFCVQCVIDTTNALGVKTQKTCRIVVGVSGCSPSVVSSDSSGTAQFLFCQYSDGKLGLQVKGESECIIGKVDCVKVPFRVSRPNLAKAWGVSENFNVILVTTIVSDPYGVDSNHPSNIEFNCDVKPPSQMNAFNSLAAEFKAGLESVKVELNPSSSHWEKIKRNPNYNIGELSDLELKLTNRLIRATGSHQRFDYSNLIHKNYAAYVKDLVSSSKFTRAELESMSTEKMLEVYEDLTASGPDAVGLVTKGNLQTNVLIQYLLVAVVTSLVPEFSVFLKPAAVALLLIVRGFYREVESFFISLNGVPYSFNPHCTESFIRKNTVHSNGTFGLLHEARHTRLFPVTLIVTLYSIFRFDNMFEVLIIVTFWGVIHEYMCDDNVVIKPSWEWIFGHRKMEPNFAHKCSSCRLHPGEVIRTKTQYKDIETICAECIPGLEEICRIKLMCNKSKGTYVRKQKTACSACIEHLLNSNKRRQGLGYSEFLTTISAYRVGDFCSESVEEAGYVVTDWYKLIQDVSMFRRPRHIDDDTSSPTIRIVSNELHSLSKLCSNSIWLVSQMIERIKDISVFRSGESKYTRNWSKTVAELESVVTRLKSCAGLKDYFTRDITVFPDVVEEVDRVMSRAHSVITKGTEKICGYSEHEFAEIVADSLQVVMSYIARVSMPSVKGQVLNECNSALIESITLMRLISQQEVEELDYDEGEFEDLVSVPFRRFLRGLEATHTACLIACEMLLTAVCRLDSVAQSAYGQLFNSLRSFRVNQSSREAPDKYVHIKEEFSTFSVFPIVTGPRHAELDKSCESRRYLVAEIKGFVEMCVQNIRLGFVDKGCLIDLLKSIKEAEEVERYIEYKERCERVNSEPKRYEEWHAQSLLYRRVAVPLSADVVLTAGDTRTLPRGGKTLQEEEDESYLRDYSMLGESAELLTSHDTVVYQRETLKDSAEGEGTPC